ncbi:hypothetical protein CEXT_117071 [Caerostris extrusa]|uniref:Transmembrane protein n=1 Tax=Caerostris extrusa TaxID=172846 RepID=A0AAV4QGL1_CAEEX|nr:hypothetical protein CEXT_117071 [Caerostris extrusa]
MISKDAADALGNHPKKRSSSILQTALTAHKGSQTIRLEVSLSWFWYVCSRSWGRPVLVLKLLLTAVVGCGSCVVVAVVVFCSCSCSSCVVGTFVVVVVLFLFCGCSIVVVGGGGGLIGLSQKKIYT